MVSSHVIWKIEKCTEDAGYKKHCPCDNEASVPFKVGALGPPTVVLVTISCPVVFSWMSLMVWNLFLFKCDFISGKDRRCRVSHLGCSGAESITWMTWCFAKQFCMRHDAWAGMLLWWSCQSPVAHSCGLLNHLNTFCGGMFKLNTKCDADSLLYSLGHFECDGHTVHMS